nr:putative sulfate exporter family transporter [Nigerium massiliense]
MPCPRPPPPTPPTVPTPTAQGPPNPAPADPADCPDADRTGPSQPATGTDGPTRKPSPVSGLLLCLAVAGVSYFLGRVSGVSALIIAIVLGVIAANTIRLPERLAPGTAVSSKVLLRAGIVFLGLQLIIGDIARLGVPMLAVIVTIVTVGILGTVLIGRALRLPPQLVILVACGFSICGAAAVAGAAGVTEPDGEHEEDTVMAVALVVLFGTLMIPLVPLLANLLHLGAHRSGLWAGGSIHEIAQVVAAGGILGGGTALTLAVVVKLSRVLLLAPVVAILGVRERRRREPSAGTKLPPLVPPFIIGFLAMVLLRSFVPLPPWVLQAGGILQTLLLAAAMFALGTGVRVRQLVQVGARPVVLAALSTVLVASTAFAGVMLAG